MNTLKSTTQHGFSDEEWYTIEELAELTGMSVETLKKGSSPLSTFGIDFKVDTKIKNVGGHRNVKLYSPNVLKAIKLMRGSYSPSFFSLKTIIFSKKNLRRQPEVITETSDRQIFS